MSDRTKLGLGMLGAALALGVAADGLLRASPWGANVALWAGGLALALAVFGRRQKEALKGAGVWLLLAVIAFSAAFAWRDSTALGALNLLAILISLALLVLRAQGGRLWPAGLVDYAGGAIVAAINAALGPLLVLFGCIEWKDVLTRQYLRRSVAVGSGLLIAFPALIIFGELLASADAVFQGMLAKLVRLISWNALSHLLLAGFFAWIVSGYLRGFVIGAERDLAADRKFSFPKLGIIEIGVAVASLDLLFLTFVLVELRYLFGGAPLVNVTRGLTYAEYARSGFFQLVAVATLSLPLLLLAHWLLNTELPRDRRLFSALAGLQIALLFVIMASALKRMQLYQSEYGLSEERLYATAFMAWLAVVFAWFALTALAGHRERFAWGALIAGFLLIAALEVINPDRLIARTNTARALAGRRFDARYNASLSADAVPTLIDALPGLNPHDQCVVAERILKEWPPKQSSDWRNWSLSRGSAWRSVSAHWQTLQTAARPGSARIAPAPVGKRLGCGQACPERSERDPRAPG